MDITVFWNVMRILTVVFCGFGVLYIACVLFANLYMDFYEVKREIDEEHPIATYQMSKEEFEKWQKETFNGTEGKAKE